MINQVPFDISINPFEVDLLCVGFCLHRKFRPPLSISCQENMFNFNTVKCEIIRWGNDERKSYWYQCKLSFPHISVLWVLVVQHLWRKETNSPFYKKKYPVSLHWSEEHGNFQFLRVEISTKRLSSSPKGNRPKVPLSDSVILTKFSTFKPQTVTNQWQNVHQPVERFLKHVRCCWLLFDPNFLKRITLCFLDPDAAPCSFSRMKSAPGLINPQLFPLPCFGSGVNIGALTDSVALRI